MSERRNEEGVLGAAAESEAKEVTKEQAIEFYKKEFARNGCYPTPMGLDAFFDRCMERDGFISSKRVAQLCVFLKDIDKDKFRVNHKDVHKFFDQLKDI